MKYLLSLVIFIGVVGPLTQAQATGWRKNSNELNVLNRRIVGRVVDHTANHGTDKRIYSRSLGQRRDLYVYLPPKFCPDDRYPIILLLHGFAQDEQAFLDIVPWIDEAICSGKLPPVIVACPDGSAKGEPCIATPGTFYMNSNAGDFEDYILCDIWDFIVRHYPIRPEREAHVMAGVSMGGFAAFNFAIRFRHAFGIAVGVYPPVNLRWMDDRGNYMANFDPRHWGWRTSAECGHEAIGRFYLGALTLRISQFLDPLYGKSQEALAEVARNNPIELIDRTGLRNGQLQMYLCYGSKDEFNIDAQVESFLYYCKYRGIEVGSYCEPHGRHDQRTAHKLFPGLVAWLGPRLAPYAPALSTEIHQAPVSDNPAGSITVEVPDEGAEPAPQTREAGPDPLLPPQRPDGRPTLLRGYLGIAPPPTLRQRMSEARGTLD